MRLRDKIPVRGCFDLRVFKGGQLIEQYRDDNMIMDMARTALAALIGGDGAGKIVTRIGFGVNGAGPSPDDTTLTAAYTVALSGHTYPVAGQIKFTWTLAASQANGKTIKEFGLLSSDNSLFARKTRGGIDKADDISLEGSWTIIF